MRRTRVWAAVLAASAMVLSFVPLFNVLGYEFSAVIATVCSFAFAHLGSVYAQQNHAEPAARSFLRVSFAHGVLLIPPLAIITLNALRVRNCDTRAGLVLYALLPGISALCATATGWTAGRLFRRGALATAMAIGAILGCLACGLLRLYWQPALFAYDPFVGFFPGPLYDEDVGVSRALISYRVMNLVYVVAIVAWASRRRLTALLALCVGIGLYAQGPKRGFRTSYAELHQLLPGRLETAHVIVRFDPIALSKRSAGAALRDHEWRYQQVASALGVAAQGKIVSYLFPSARVKRRWIGAGGTSVAKPWRREIYLNQEEPPHGTLKHELAHVLAGSIDPSLFATPITNLGLVEGLATAVENPVDNGVTLHEQARVLVDLGLAPPLASLFGVGLLTQAPARSYTLAGSFMRFVLDHRGREFVRQAYRTGSIPDFAPLERQWRDFLARVEVPSRARTLLADRFRRPAIFRRSCAHDIALLRKQAFAAPLRARAAIWQQIAMFDPDNPEALVDVARANAEVGDGAAAKRTAKRALMHPKTTETLRQRTNELLGDLAWREGDLATARVAYERAAHAVSSDATERLLTLKRRALGDPTTEHLYRQFLLPGGERDALLDAVVLGKLEGLRPNDGLPPYLLGRQLVAHGQFSEAASTFARALTRELPDVAFRRECLRLLALATWKARDLDRAETATEQLLKTADTAGARSEAADLLERIRWEKRL